MNQETYNEAREEIHSLMDAFDDFGNRLVALEDLFSKEGFSECVFGVRKLYEPCSHINQGLRDLLECSGTEYEISKYF